MKALFLLLLAANIGWFGWQYNQATSRRLLQLQEHQEYRPLPAELPRLRLLTELAALPPERGEGKVAEPAAAREETFVAASPPEGAGGCYTLGPFHDPGAARRLKEGLQQADYQAWIRSEKRQVQTHFWVYLEPASSEAAAREKLQELERKGLQDYQLIKRGSFRGAISLGLFRHRESVTRRLAELKREGYQPVVVPRYRTRVEYWLDFSPPAATGAAWTQEVEMPRKIPCPVIAKGGSDSYNAPAEPE